MMNRLRQLNGSGWFLAGVLVALVVVPASAAAATIGVTELAGSDGQGAAVTRAGQLDTAEAPPSSFVTRLGGADLTSSSQSKCAPDVRPALAAIANQKMITRWPHHVKGRLKAKRKSALLSGRADLECRAARESGSDWLRVAKLHLLWARG
jgi:hypothetical protein